jgi:hypothetical protein
MLIRFANGQSFQIVGTIGVAMIILIQLTRLVRDWLKTFSLVLQHDCCDPHCRGICSHGEHRVRVNLRKDHAWRGNEP